MNYSCKQVKDFLPAYLDNMTNQFETEAIEKHLFECAECRKELEFLKSIVGITASFPSFEVPDGFYERLREKLIAEKNSNRVAALSKMWKTAIPLISAACVIAIFIVSSSFTQNKDINQNPISRTIENEQTETDAQGNARKSSKKRILILSDIIDFFEPEPKPTQTPRPTEKPRKTQSAVSLPAQNSVQTGEEIPSGEQSSPGTNASAESNAPAENVDAPAIDYSNVPPKIKVTANVLVTPSDTEVAKQLLSGYKFEDGYYILSDAQYQTALGNFDALGINVSLSQEDKTAEYAALQNMINSQGVDKTNIEYNLNTIDDEVSKIYVKIVQ